MDEDVAINLSVSAPAAAGQSEAIKLLDEELHKRIRLEGTRPPKKRSCSLSLLLQAADFNSSPADGKYVQAASLDAAVQAVATQPAPLITAAASCGHSVEVMSQQLGPSDASQSIIAKSDEPRDMRSSTADTMLDGDQIKSLVFAVNQLSDFDRFVFLLHLSPSLASCGLMERNNRLSEMKLAPQNSVGIRREIQLTVAWIKSHLQLDSTVSLPKQEVYDCYCDFCTEQQIKPLSTADFGKVIKQVFPDVRPRRLGTRGHSRYCYSGLKRRHMLESPQTPEIVSHISSDSVSSPLFNLSIGDGPSHVGEKRNELPTSRSAVDIAIHNIIRPWLVETEKQCQTVDVDAASDIGQVVVTVARLLVNMKAVRDSVTVGCFNDALSSKSLIGRLSSVECLLPTVASSTGKRIRVDSLGNHVDGCQTPGQSRHPFGDLQFPGCNTDLNINFESVGTSSSDATDRLGASINRLERLRADLAENHDRLTDVHERRSEFLRNNLTCSPLSQNSIQPTYIECRARDVQSDFLDIKREISVDMPCPIAAVCNSSDIGDLRDASSLDHNTLSSDWSADVGDSGILLTSQPDLDASVSNYDDMNSRFDAMSAAATCGSHSPTTTPLVSPRATPVLGQTGRFLSGTGHQQDSFGMCSTLEGGSTSGTRLRHHSAQARLCARSRHSSAAAGAAAPSQGGSLNHNVLNKSANGAQSDLGQGNKLSPIVFCSAANTQRWRNESTFRGSDGDRSSIMNGSMTMVALQRQLPQAPRQSMDNQHPAFLYGQEAYQNVLPEETCRYVDDIIDDNDSMQAVDPSLLLRPASFVCNNVTMSASMVEPFQQSDRSGMGGTDLSVNSALARRTPEEFNQAMNSFHQQ